MSYGFQLTGTDSKILIDSEFDSLHCAGAATYESVTSSFAYNDSGLGGEGCKVFKYSIPLSSSASPLLFIKPHNNYYSRYYGIIQLQHISNKWEFEVLMGGAPVGEGFRPTIYVFVKPQYIFKNNGDTNGLITYKANNTESFNSAKSPLQILVGGEVKAGDCAPTTGCTPTATKEGTTTLDWDFQSADETSYDIESYVSGIGLSNLMFSAPAIGQACWQRVMHRHWETDAYYWWSSTIDHDETKWYWMFYRSTFSVNIPSGSTNIHTHAGWTGYTGDVKRLYVREDDTTWGDDSVTEVGGDAPFYQERLNHIYNMMLVTDVRRYT